MRNDFHQLLRSALAGRVFRYWLFAAYVGLGACVVAPAYAAPVIPSKYDREIRKAARLYLPNIPWRLLKAQLYQESRLDPAARSPVGAEGLGQFMRPAWEECSVALGFAGIPRNAAAQSIQCSAWYMNRLKQRWRGAQEYDLHRLAAAGYNAGNGNISRANRACGEPLTWVATAVCLPGVTGRHAQETIVYVSRIWQWWEYLEATR